MRVMLDNGIEAHSQFAVGQSFTSHFEWNGKPDSCQVAGLVRKPLHSDPSYQAEIDALFTIGRLIRERRIEAFTYVELKFEGWKRHIGEIAFDALSGCSITQCDSPVERSQFFQGDAFAYVAKGGKEDRKAGKDTSLSQVRFVEWLLGLKDEHVLKLISLRNVLKLSDFEIESLHNLSWLRSMCKIAQSSENFPDMLHIWAAQRNRMDVFLTLESRLPNIAAHFPQSKFCAPSFPTRVMRPQALLKLLGRWHRLSFSDQSIRPLLSFRSAAEESAFPNCRGGQNADPSVSLRDDNKPTFICKLPYLSSFPRLTFCHSVAQRRNLHSRMSVVANDADPSVSLRDDNQAWSQRVMTTRGANAILSACFLAASITSGSTSWRAAPSSSTSA